MKLTDIKKIKKEFDPVHHWYTLVIVVNVIFLLIIAYALYSFFYIKNQISSIELDSKNNIQNSTSTESLEKNINNKSFLKDVNNLNKILDEYSKKETEYNRLINNAVNFTVNTSISTTSLKVATSTE